MAHTLFIALHAAGGIVAFVAGLFALGPRRRGLRIYLAGLVVLVAGMAGALAVGWSDRDTTARVVFGALAVLACYLLWRADRARRAEYSPRYADHVGFTLIALLDGFLIVGAIDLGLPVWLVIAVAVLTPVAGHAALQRFKHRRQPHLP